jgi:signal transduction histidine kinase
MFSKLFIKYYLRMSAIILASFVLIGVTLFIFVWKYSSDEKQKQLYQGAVRVAGLTSALSDSFSQSFERPYRNSLQFISESTNADIFIADTNGNVVVVSTINKIKNNEAVIPNNIVKSITDKGLIKETGKLGGFFTEIRYSVGMPFLIGDNAFGGVVILSSLTGQIDKLMYDIMSMFGIALILALIISFIWLYFTTNKLIYPLKAMSSAAKSFAAGKFDEKINVEGNDEIAQLSLSFNHMADSLTKLEEMRSSFVSNVSHDLKTPMTTISGFIDGILDGTIPKEKNEHYLTIVSNEVKRLSRLVNSLLDIARINEGENSYLPEPFDVGKMLMNIADNIHFSTNQKNITIKKSIPDYKITAFADEDAIYRVVYNLAENAVKFTPNDGIIEFITAFDGKKIYVSVKNTGAGIKADDIPYIFDRFYKADKSRGMDKQGIGLGLFMAKQIINAHKEELWVNSEEGKYAEFIFTLSPQT